MGQSVVGKMGALVVAMLLASFLGPQAVGQSEKKSVPSQEEVVQKLKESLDKGLQEVEAMKNKLEEMTKPLQSVLQGVADRDVLQAISDLLHKSNWPLFWWTQLGVFVLVLLLRSWLVSRASQWHRRLLADLWTSLVYLLLLLVAVPFATIGEPYRKIVKTAWEIYRSM